MTDKAATITASGGGMRPAAGGVSRRMAQAIRGPTICRQDRGKLVSRLRQAFDLDRR
jgi:hypothetical protein